MIEDGIDHPGEVLFRGLSSRESHTAEQGLGRHIMRNLDGPHWLIEVGYSIGETRGYSAGGVGVGPSGEGARVGLDLHFAVDRLCRPLCVQLWSAVRVKQI